MEILLGLAIIIIGAAFWYWNRKPEVAVTEAQPETAPEAPYKLEAPVAPKIEVVEAKTEVPAATAQKPAKAKKTTAKKAKPATDKTPAKKTPKLKRSK